MNVLRKNFPRGHKNASSRKQLGNKIIGTISNNKQVRMKSSRSHFSLNEFFNVVQMPYILTSVRGVKVSENLHHLGQISEKDSYIQNS